MIITRLKEPAGLRVSQVPIEDADSATIAGNNRELMRHGDGALHAGMLDGSSGVPRLFLYGTRGASQPLGRLGGPLGPEQSGGEREPATDSNHNGTYVAFVSSADDGQAAGYVAHLPDPFDDPGERRLHGPLTPQSGTVAGTFLQASRRANSVVYGWRDGSGTQFVGVSLDGAEFPGARPVVKDAKIVFGPSVGIRGEYVLLVFGTTDERFAPRGAHPHKDAVFYAWCESGEGALTGAAGL